MSRLLSEDEYKKTKAGKVKSWYYGEKDPYIGNLEMNPEWPNEAEDNIAFLQKEIDGRLLKQRVYNVKKNKVVRGFDKVNNVLSVIFVIILIATLLYMVANLPPVGSADKPDNNEVAQKYIEDGIDDTGAVNVVTGMILSYRAFDTFGETCVLFIATTCVMVLLMKKEEELRSDVSLNDRLFEPKNDSILQKVAFFLVPIIFIFGIYVILNGHLSPGGGFSGGAIMGAGMILYACAFGFDKMQKFFNEETYTVVKVTALITYCVVISYYLYMGANDFENHIPLGTPGMILSSGIILWLNIFVGTEVACTMYAFYALFRRGGL